VIERSIVELEESYIYINYIKEIIQFYFKKMAITSMTTKN